MMIGGDKDGGGPARPDLRGAVRPGIGDMPAHRRARRAATPGSSRATCIAGPVGAGHFVKMIHNGIEYGLMQAYAEGFDILKNANIEALPAEHRFDLDIADIAEVWRRGSGDPVMAARSHLLRIGGKSYAMDRNIPASWRIPAKAAGPSMRRSTRRCRRRC